MATVRTRVVGNNFDPYLVGLQWTSEGGTPLFTIGNFQVTTNLTSPPKRNFQLGSFSDPLTLENLGTTLSEATQFVNDNYNIFLNLNTENLLSFSLFGSFKEFVRVELEQIQLNWPASIYVFYAYGTTTGNTMTNYSYNSGTGEASFDVSTNFFYNYYNINFLQSGALLPNTSIASSIRNLSVYYPEYEIFINGQSYPIIGFTGSTTITNGSVSFIIEGDPLNGATNTTLSYHIRPNSRYLERFFSNLDDFGRFLLNRNTVPQYTCMIYYEEQNENYQVLQRSQRFTWPVTDGYNLDLNTGEFLLYRKSLLDIAESYDEYRTDLMRRMLVTESVSYFELNPRLSSYIPINTTEKIDKLLNVYGREFDEVRKYIEGISFAATVSYNKQGNTPDPLIKDFAYYLGWDILSPMDENQLFQNFMPTQSVFSGMTVGYTPAEAEIEFWRRLVLNSSFLWKSKGTRKPIEFLFDFINTPPSLVKFNEYIYQAKNKLDINNFRQIIQYLYDDTNLDGYNVDEDGYPKVPVDTLQNYFQKGGGWYRETAGTNSQVDYYEGNNPHIGPYDGGQFYIDSFRCLLENFSGQTIKITNEYVEFTNIFSNYYGGAVEDYTGQIYVDPVDNNNNPTDCILITGTVVTAITAPEFTICGCLLPSGLTKAIIINVRPNPNPNPGCSTAATPSCPSDLIPHSVNPNGVQVWINGQGLFVTQVNAQCCDDVNGTYEPITQFCYVSNPTGGSGNTGVGIKSWVISQCTVPCNGVSYECVNPSTITAYTSANVSLIDPNTVLYSDPLGTSLLTTTYFSYFGNIYVTGIDGKPNLVGQINKSC